MKVKPFHAITAAAMSFGFATATNHFTVPTFLFVWTCICSVACLVACGVFTLTYFGQKDERLEAEKRNSRY